MMDFRWRETLAKKPGQRKSNCWISPRGDWYNVVMADHEPFAISYMKDQYGESYDWRKAGEALMDRGWLYVQSDVISGVIVRGSDHMSPDQYMVLYEYWGDTMLFRGWCIKTLWEKSKYNPEAQGYLGVEE